jgi:23S rRNA (guanosine2251-2'-O)-methyltransferase
LRGPGSRVRGGHLIIYGINPVLEALRARRVQRLRISSRADKRMDELVAIAGKQGIPIERVDPQALDRASRGGVHQGVAADIDMPREYSIAELVLPPEGGSHQSRPESQSHASPHASPWLPPSGGRSLVPLLIVLDGVEDPQNVGAILRTADAAGVTGLIRQARHSAALDGVAGKASAGALAHARIATVVNVARAVEELKEAHVWTVGLAGDAPEPYTAVDFTLPTAIVLGAEGTGLRRLVADRCDRLVHIPMLGSVSSLNVSVAAGVVLYEAVRQRIVGAMAKGK